jgi:hypothetical protein
LVEMWRVHKAMVDLRYRGGKQICFGWRSPAAPRTEHGSMSRRTAARPADDGWQLGPLPCIHPCCGSRTRAPVPGVEDSAVQFIFIRKVYPRRPGGVN